MTLDTAVHASKKGSVSKKRETKFEKAWMVFFRQKTKHFFADMEVTLPFDIWLMICRISKCASIRDIKFHVFSLLATYTRKNRCLQYVNKTDEEDEEDDEH